MCCDSILKPLKCPEKLLTVLFVMIVYKIIVSVTTFASYIPLAHTTC